jgi:NAD(P)-dependent dehydrogenase (short-subunit alcohol dehydrogenase family)
MSSGTSHSANVADGSFALFWASTNDVRCSPNSGHYAASHHTRRRPEEKKAAFAERSLLKRACKPHDIAEIIVFLCHGAKVVTGQTIVADAGFTLA